MAAVEAAKEKDAEVNAEAFMAGRPTPKVLDKHEREALARVAGLRAAINAAGKAVDGAGNALVRAVPAAQEEWLEALREQEAAAVERYSKSVAEARAALAELEPLVGGIAYLELFSVGDVMAGRDRHGWHGRGRVRVDGEGFGAYRDEQDPAKLLELAAKVGQPRMPQTGITHGPVNVVKPS